MNQWFKHVHLIYSEYSICWFKKNSKNMFYSFNAIYDLQLNILSASAPVYIYIWFLFGVHLQACIFFKGPASILFRNSLEGSSILQCPVRRTWKREWKKKHAIITWHETPQLQTLGPQAKVAVVHEPGAASNVKRCKKVRLVCGKCVNIYICIYVFQ